VINLEWKWVKTLLIVLFLILNCFLGWQVYLRNSTSVINPEAISSLESILDSKNITCNFKLNSIEVKKYMKKIKISNEKTIEEKFIPISYVDQDVEYSGRNREIMPLPTILVNFIRDTKLTDVNLVNISLGYYPEINQIDTNILSGEATPAWLICLANGEEYVYNAYLGNLIKSSKSE